MSEPQTITYERWWSVYASHPFKDSEDFADPEQAVRRAVEMLEGGAMFVNVAKTDREKAA